MTRVLIIDDQEDIRMLLAEILTSQGISVIGQGKDGMEAVDLCKSLRPDAILLDVTMPEYDGIYALEKITSLGIQTKTIVITGDQSQTTTHKIKKQSPTAILYKPPDIQEIMKILKD